jgi:hypothetical protein
MKKRLISIMFVLALTQGAQAKCQPTKIETDINAIRLADEQSTERVLGKIDALPFKKPPGSDEDELLLYNRDKTEQAVLTYAAGGYSPGSFQIIEVKKRAPTDLPGKTLDVPKFSTERGIQLGVSPDFVISLLGKCYSKSSAKSGETTVEYALDDVNLRHPFLKRANIPSYYGRYHFRNGKLEAFEIGSEAP